MEENSSRIIEKGALKKGPIKKNHRSGKCCGSCMAALVADCVAICCCPCAVLSFLALIFCKAPWMVGRRCLGRGKKERKCPKIDGNLTSKRVAKGISETVLARSEDEQLDNVGPGCEADRVSTEPYQLGYSGFGRSSFTGDQI